MSVWQLPPVREAVLAVMGEWKAVRQQRPNWPPLQALREAKRRHVNELVDAVTAITKAEELARNGVWSKPTPQCHESKRPLAEHLTQRRAAATERYQRIRELAAEHPDWTYAQIAKEVGCGTATVCEAMRRA